MGREGQREWSKESDKRRQERGKEREIEGSCEQVGSGREIGGEFSQKILKSRAGRGTEPSQT